MFTNRILSKCLFLAWGMTLLSASNVLAQSEEVVRWKFEEGQETKYEMKQNMDMTMPMGAMEIEMKMKQTIQMVWQVTKIKEDGSAIIEQRIERVKMKMTAEGAPMFPGFDYDSASEEEPDGMAAHVAPMFDAMIDNKFTMTISPQGEITDIKIPEEFIEALEANPAVAAMGEFASEEGLKQISQNASLLLPETLTVGQEWENEFSMNNPATGEMIVKTKYRYEGPQSVDGTTYDVFVPEISMEFGEAGGMVQMEVVDHETDGKILFNREAGRIEKSTVNQSMTMIINAGGQEIEQDMNQQMVLQVVDSFEEPSMEEEATEDDSSEDE